MLGVWIKRSIVFIGLALSAYAAPSVVSAASANANNPIVLKVNGVAVRESDLATAAEMYGESLLPKDEKERRDFLINYTTDMILLANDAKSSKFARGEDLRRLLAFTRYHFLMTRQLEKIGAAAITDDALHRAYDKARKEGSGVQETHVRDILFRFDNPSDEPAVKAAEKKAEAALDRLKKNEDFETVAKEFTEFPMGKANGGDLGWLSDAQMGLEFNEVAPKLEVGQISGLIKTAFGWHIIKIEGRRERELPSFDEVRKQVELVVARQAQIDLINKLRAAAEIERPGQKAPAPRVSTGAATESK